MQKEYLDLVLGEAFFTRPQNLENLIFSNISQAPQAEPLPVAVPIVNISSLEEIRNNIGNCTRCKLSKTRTNIVFGKGSSQATVLFVGEGPGEQEDLQGLPFVGKAGELLDKIISAMGLSLEQIYIANVVKCRPPGNRTPEPDEVETCIGFLEHQIKVIGPKILVALGSTALKSLMGDTAKITRMRGTMMEYTSQNQKIPLMPTFHPSYLLRNPDAKKDVWNDMKLVLEFLKKNSI